MDVNSTFVLSQVILFPLVVGLVRYKTVRVDYRPFFWLLVIGFLCEDVSYLLIERYQVHTNAVPINIYILCEWVLLAFQFHHWGFLKSNKKLFYALLLGTAGIWVVENLVFDQITVFRPYFPFFYSFLLVLLSVREINFMITHDNRVLLKNTRFLICIGFIIYFIYKIVFEWAYQLSLLGKSDFTTTIIYLFSYINVVTNIIFGIALLIIPQNREFKLE
ncbi:MAG TPA: hypothetical protein VK543_16010 [Puia sp.]|nr:hypothetical protein [Puia sp.]